MHTHICTHTGSHLHGCLGGEAFSLGPPTGPWLEAAELVPRPLLQSARHLSATAGARAGGEWPGASLLGGQLAGTLTCNWAAWDGWSSLMRCPVRLRGLKGLNALWAGLALAENCFLVPGRPLLLSDQEPGPDLPAPQCEGATCSPSTVCRQARGWSGGVQDHASGHFTGSKELPSRPGAQVLWGEQQLSPGCHSQGH